jgi:hypothetical protein
MKNHLGLFHLPNIYTKQNRFFLTRNSKKDIMFLVSRETEKKIKKRKKENGKQN